MSTLRMTSDLRRQLILGAAKRCFARNGFAGTTTKSVAAAAAISEGLLFKHFPSKAALYAEILAEECEADPDLAHLLGQEPSTATLVELVQGMVGHFLGVAGDEQEAQRLRLMTTMAEIEAFKGSLQDVSAGPRFASVKIDAANLDRALSNRDGTYIVNRIRGSLGFQPI